VAKRIAHFTDARVRALKPEATRYDTYDDDARGLVVTVRPEGSKVFYLVRKIDGRVVRYRIARTDELSVEKARKQAEVLGGQAALGKNPADERRKVRAAMTLGELWELFKARRGEKKRSLPTDTNRYTLHLAAWAKKKLSAITRADVATLLAKITTDPDRGPIAANRTRALLHTMFAVGIEAGLEIANPVSGSKRNPENTKSRYLQPDELRRFWRALVAEPEDDVRDFLQVLLLTGVRSGSLAAARWADIDLKDAVWHIPPESMKAGKSLDLPLAPRAVKILKARQQHVASEWIFPSPRTESGHLATVLRDGWVRVLAVAKITRVTPHDLRRTHATYGLAAGIPIEVLGKALGHTPIGGVTAIYAQADLQLVRLAVERTVDAILRVAEAPDTKNARKVLEFPRPAWAKGARA
jgi:integrase